MATLPPAAAAVVIALVVAVVRRRRHRDDWSINVRIDRHRVDEPGDRDH